MKAAVYDQTGPANKVLKIKELPDPEPGPGEVRVKVAWSGVNPSDVKSRSGIIGSKLPFPEIIPHSDGSGIIDAVGKDVDASRQGQRVWLWNAAWGRPDGTAAQYVVLPAAQAVPLPDNCSLEIGACLGIPALTAYHAVSMDGGVSGKSVLVTGGAGAVGHYAIQFARFKGAARIITTVSSPEKAALAKSAGAGFTINYKNDNVAGRCREATAGAGINRIIEVDFAANAGTDFDVVRQEGDMVIYGSGSREIPVSFGSAIRKNVRLRFFIVYNLLPDDRANAISDLTEMLKQDRLLHNVAVRLPLEKIAEAHELVESGRAMGKVLLKIES